MHVEWESGLGQGNEGNPCAELNKRGISCGGATGGHQRGNKIWNWPTTGDWVHVEGLWIWDRGHPPAEAEIHPMRFMAIRRGLPDLIAVEEMPQGYATRIDLYASGNGGALHNNKPNAPPFVHKVNMSNRNYTFKTYATLPRPSANAKLKYEITDQPGNTFNGRISATVNEKDSSCIVTVYWKDDNVPDTALLAKTVYLYWAEGNGTRPGEVSTIKLKLNKLKIKRRKEFWGRSEFRVFVEVGGNWFFLNELYGTKDDILNHGLGKTTKRNFKINKEFILTVPKGKDFRVYATGWEADGMDRLFGHLVNDYSPCNAQTKRIFSKKGVVNLNKTAIHGCLDDQFGEAANWHKAEDITGIIEQQLAPPPGNNIDVCPCSKFKLEKGYRLYYTVEKVN